MNSTKPPTKAPGLLLPEYPPRLYEHIERKGKKSPTDDPVHASLGMFHRLMIRALPLQTEAPPEHTGGQHFNEAIEAKSCPSFLAPSCRDASCQGPSSRVPCVGPATNSLLI